MIQYHRANFAWWIGCLTTWCLKFGFWKLVLGSVKERGRLQGGADESAFRGLKLKNQPAHGGGSDLSRGEWMGQVC